MRSTSAFCAFLVTCSCYGAPPPALGEEAQDQAYQEPARVPDIQGRVAGVDAAWNAPAAGHEPLGTASAGAGAPLLSRSGRTNPPSCGCDQVGVTGSYTFQSYRMGVYTRQAFLTNGRWVYKRVAPIGTDNYLFYSSSGSWLIGPDYTTNLAGIKSAFTNADCPEDAGADGPWKLYDGSNWVESSTAGGVNVICRISAVACCEMGIAHSDQDSIDGNTWKTLLGTYQSTDQRTPDGRWIFVLSGTQTATYLYFYAPIQKWVIGSDVTKDRGWLMSKGTDSICPSEVTAWWVWTGSVWLQPTPSIQNSCCGVQVRAMWIPHSYSSGANTIEYYAGFTTASSLSTLNAWKGEISASASAGIQFRPEWAQVQTTVEISATISKEFTEEVTRSMEISSSVKQTSSFDEAGQVWQWAFVTRDMCVPAATNTISTYTLVLTDSRPDQPCCPAAYTIYPKNQHGPCEPAAADLCINVCSEEVCTADPPSPPPSPSRCV